jgi:hypothetical protein
MGPGTAQVTQGPTAADENKTLEEAHVRCVFNNGRFAAPQKIAASCQSTKSLAR